MKKVFVTGASGFAGSHLVEYLVEKGEFDVYGTAFGEGGVLVNSIPDDHIFQLDLMDHNAVGALVAEIKPDWVFHLAALTSPAASYKDPATTLTNNISAQLYLLEALCLLPHKPQTLIVGSAEEYGMLENSVEMIDEQTPLRPASPYAVSKVAQDFMGLQYYLSNELPTVRVRPFNHLGERQSPAFVLPAFAQQVALIEAGLAEPTLNVGNLTPIRDFTDVKDMVRAYVLALEKGDAGEVYNLGSGRGVPAQKLVDLLLAEVKLKITVKTDPKRFRPADVPKMVCDAHKFRAKTGWQVTISLEETVKRVLDYWRQQVKGGDYEK